jgi:hypothetical protein
VLFFEEHNVSKIVLVLVARTHARHTRVHNAYIYITRARASKCTLAPFRARLQMSQPYIIAYACWNKNERRNRYLCMCACACVETRARTLTQKITMSCREAAVGDGRSRNTADGGSLFR